MSVVIAGCGDLGTEAGLRFLKAGRHVVGMRRSAHRLPAEFERYSLDLAHEIPILPTDTEILILATSADRRTESAYREAYVDSLTNILTALDRAEIEPPCVLMISSSAVYGQNDGSWVDETTPTAPRADTAHVLIEAEAILHARVPTATILRLTGIYGPGRTRLIEQARTGTEVANDGVNFTNRIHRDDAAAAMVHLTTMAATAAPLYLGVDDEPTDRREVMRFLAAELGVAQPLDQLTATPPYTGKRCRNTLLRSTGFELTYPTYREGYRAVLAGAGQRHR